MRKLSRFLCQELLYDYETGQLDAERVEAVEAYLPTCKETQKELELLRAGLEFTASLSRSSVSVPMVEKLRNTKGWWNRTYQRLNWNNWTDWMKWGAEGLVVASVVAFLVIVIPWHRVVDTLSFKASWKELQTVEVRPQPAEVDEMGDGSAKQEELRPDGFKIEHQDILQAGPAETPVTTEVISSEAEEAEETEEAKEPKESPSAPPSFVYRAAMNLAQVDAATEKIRDKIIELGGKKAGQVELGWRRGESSYFHFSLPEENYETLLESLRTLGPVRIYKDPHSRVMPKGTIRIILDVDPQR